MLDKLKAFNTQHDGLPVKIGFAIFGGVVCAAVAGAIIYNYNASTAALEAVDIPFDQLTEAAVSAVAE